MERPAFAPAFFRVALGAINFDEECRRLLPTLMQDAMPHNLAPASHKQNATKRRTILRRIYETHASAWP
jgi:hypothetical protein